MPTNRKAVKWKGDILDVLDTQDGQMHVLLDADPDVDVVNHGEMNWLAAHAWLTRIATRDERWELQEYLLMNFFEE